MTTNKISKERLVVILYNYVQPGEHRSPGGGVTVYLRNLRDSLRSAGHQVHILSSGDRYTIINRKPFLKQKEDNFVIYNSPVVAPAIFSFYHPEIFLQNKELDHIPSEILKQAGSVDVFHFHNIEGLTQSFFYELRRVFPKSTIIFTAHNYHIGCSQVNLWKHGTESCNNFSDGYDCINCAEIKDSYENKILINKIKTVVKNNQNFLEPIIDKIYRFDKYYRRSVKLNVKAISSTRRDLPGSVLYQEKAEIAKLYVLKRTAGARLINDVFDKTIAVSKRTADILYTFGGDKNKIIVSYIGTKHFQNYKLTPKKIPQPENLHIGYLGYMRKDKGFFYFLKSLEILPKEIKNKISVTIAAKAIDKSCLSRINKLIPQFKKLYYYDGYNHGTISQILNPINLGVIPALWEDNLPQVAIEFVSYGIPLITSNMGGAQEISGNKKYIFDISVEDSLCEFLCAIVDGEIQINDFWDNNLNIHSNDNHASELIQIYRSALASRNIEN